MLAGGECRQGIERYITDFDVLIDAYILDLRIYVEKESRLRWFSECQVDMPDSYRPLSCSLAIAEGNPGPHEILQLDVLNRETRTNAGNRDKVFDAIAAVERKAAQR